MSTATKPFLGIGWKPLFSYFLLFWVFIACVQLYTLYKPSIWETATVGFFSAAILAWITYRRLINPIEEMAYIAQDMARGNLEQEIRIFAQDEIGDLARSINYLSRELKKNIDDIVLEKNKIQAILASMSDGVIAMDNWGRVILINPIVEKYFNITLESSKGKNIRRLIRNNDFDKLLNRFLETGSPVQKQIRLMTPEPRLFQVQVIPLQEKGTDDGGMVALLMDLTEKKKLEEMRSEFVANVSHELRTPLTSIKGFTETLLDGALEETQNARRFLEIINVESERLTRLIDELLSISKIENQKMTPDWQPVVLKEVIESAVTVLQPRATEKNLTVEVHIPADLPLVQGDSDMLRQVLLNLIDNAVSYTQPGGLIQVRAGVAGHRIEVSVQDNGIGIPEDSIPRVFERFYRVDRARSREQGGTGLGLSIVKHIVDVHYGQVEVKSKVGEGSTFSFTLPIDGRDAR